VSLQTDSDKKTPNKIVDIDRSGAARTLPQMSRNAVIAASNSAVRTIAPLWPLESFVAVNPFLGIANLPYADADNTVDRIWGARLVMPRTFYAEAIRSGQIQRRHIEEALAEVPGDISGDHSVSTIHLLAFTEEPESHPTPTIAEILSRQTGEDWHGFIIDRISFWAASYFDEGQASWRSPWRGETPYAAWRGEAELDRTPEIMGIPDFRGIVRTLPADADELLYRVATDLDLRGDAFDIYLRRLLATVAGWAGHARYRGWQQELAGGSDDRIKGLLAVRAAWDLALYDAFSSRYPDAAEALRRRLTTPLHPDISKSHAVNLILHTAYEIAGRESVLAALPTPAGPASSADESDAAPVRPSAQTVFCIDVRSERFRRSLEEVDGSIETLGFAGFFGFALEVAPIDESSGGAQCPVLLTPQFLVRETAPGASPDQVERLAQRTRLGRRLTAAWKHFSAAAISSFAFVESLGLTYAWKLIADSLGVDLKRGQAALVPSIETDALGGRSTGISLEQRVQTARGVLGAMSLTDNFARVVALIGHGSTTANNPYASRFNCGACGGHTGEANALVAAQVLNDPRVRASLAAQGLEIPADTLFVAGLHDTTTDEVRLLVAGDMPESHIGDLAELESALAEAGRRNRRKRAPSFGLRDNGSADGAVIRRSRDWSEIRPEWGLAGCMSFIAAPRTRTLGTDLGGRAFLHSYDHAKDEGYEVLELIMTAPLIVASWISLQYYASTVDNKTFGSGDKTLHNVVGGLGVLEGNGGDLRVGLPLQSLHDGDRYMHQPMRLNAFIEAPTEAITAVLARHDHLRQLVDNGWIHLFAITDEGQVIKRYRGGDGWCDAGSPQAGSHAGEARAPERRRA
jgi:uncharacterized protein YbcC (UPF0753/DUF2309 family)